MKSKVKRGSFWDRWTLEFWGKDEIPPQSHVRNKVRSAQDCRNLLWYAAVYEIDKFTAKFDQWDVVCQGESIFERYIDTLLCGLDDVDIPAEKKLNANLETVRSKRSKGVSDLPIFAVLT